MLRAHGWDDTAIHDAIQVIGYFNYINRIADAVGSTTSPSGPTGRSRVALPRPPCAPQHAAVAEAARDPVLVEPLEQQLRIAAADPARSRKRARAISPAAVHSATTSSRARS